MRIHSAIAARGVELLGCLICLLSTAATARGQEVTPPAPAQCEVDLKIPGAMKDVLSNALTRGLHVRESEVRMFLRGREKKHATGRAMLLAAVKRFGVEEDKLAALVEEYRHCNCEHAKVEGGSVKSRASPAQRGAGAKHDVLSNFARDVTMHVVLHELGHALIREFDLPVLGNEETMADAFATHYLTTHLPTRAFDVLEARIESLMIEAREVPRAEWSVRGEHNSDARRAFQIAALAIAANPERYGRLAKAVGMSASDLAKSKDYGTEIHRSWRRVLQPVWMPNGVASTESRIKHDENDSLLRQLAAGGLLRELAAVLQRFDWHSQVTIDFAAGDGGAGWSRSKRTITVRSGYVRRFVEQGAKHADRLGGRRDDR